jgi:hypothetical protein
MSKNKPKFTTQNTDSYVSDTDNQVDQTDQVDKNTTTGLFKNPFIVSLLSSITGSITRPLTGSLTGSLNTGYVNNIISDIGSNINNVLLNVSNHPFLQNDTNRGWVLIASSIFGTFFLISMLWKFIFNFMLSYASVKVVLWFLEHYKPDESSDEVASDHYVSETSSVDVIEYLVVLLFVTSLTPLSYLPYMSLMVNGSCVMLSVTTLASKEYRRKICKFVKDALVSPDYKPGHKMEGKIHSSLQTFCHTIETLNIGTFNMTHNSRSVYTDLKTSNSFTDGLRKLTQKPLKLIMSKSQNNKTKQNNDLTDDFDDDLDESFN